MRVRRREARALCWVRVKRVSRVSIACFSGLFNAWASALRVIECNWTYCNASNAF